MSASLGQHLKDRREALGLSLRDVERITDGKVSNAYLSQIETGKIDGPSVIMLHRLSAAYALDFSELCDRACAGNPPLPSPLFCDHCGQVLKDPRP